VKTVEDAVDLADYAEAARVFARKAKLGTSAQNHALAIRLRAERRLADLVDAGQKAGTIAEAGGNRLTIIPSGNNGCGRPAPLDSLGITAKDVHEARAIRDKFTDEQIDAAAKEATETLTRRQFINPHVANNSGQNEWYTPPEYIEAARRVMGHIALDPATSITAQRTVRASVYFTAEHDGLAHDWFGPIWMNPPYSQPLIGQFIDKLTDTDAESICLVNNGTETVWGQKLLRASDAVCFPAGRIRFIDPDGNPSGAPLQGQMITYRGPSTARFTDEFATFGTVMGRG
jgi:hypothetical protein